jgi:hypothetical protein
MRVFVQYVNGRAANGNTYAAQEGFEKLGAEVIPFDSLAAPDGLGRGDIVCGWLGTVKGALRRLGVVANELEYPDQLRMFYGREVYKADWAHASDPANWPLFVKPTHQKKFAGFVVRDALDLANKGRDGDEVWCAGVVNMLSEFRCFVRYGQLVGMKHYAGDPFLVPDHFTVVRMLLACRNMPAGFTLDVAVVNTQAGTKQTVLVEANDGYSLNTYGLDPVLYAQVVSARWCELVGIPDPYQL